MIEYKARPDSEWKIWPTMNIPSPPPEREIPFAGHRCTDHGACVDWCGVHFVAVRYNGKEWHACCSVCSCDNEAYRETFYNPSCPGCDSRMASPVEGSNR